MINVLLVLIIIFMVAVSSIQKKGLAAEIPQPSEKGGSDVRTIVIQIRAAGDQQPPTLKINDQKATWETCSRGWWTSSSGMQSGLPSFRVMMMMSITSTSRTPSRSLGVLGWTGLGCCRESVCGLLSGRQAGPCSAPA